MEFQWLMSKDDDKIFSNFVDYHKHHKIVIERIDRNLSRIIKVLRELKFPVPLSSTALADEAYYCFVEDGIQEIMSRIGVFPCVFDACAFASFERNV